MPQTYSTISIELVEYADMAAAKLRADGYRVQVEHSSPYFPVTPTLRGYRSKKELIVEVLERCSFGMAKKWIAYGKAQSQETKVAIVVPPQRGNIPADEIAQFQEAGIGLWVGREEGLVLVAHPRDLSNQVVCPDISGDHRRVRAKLQPGFTKIENGEIIDGFKDVAIAVEVLARKRLLDGVRSGRILFASQSGNPIVYSETAINRGTMGWLRDRYSEIVSPNGTDNVVFQTFKAVCDDRNLVNHNELSPSQRRAIGQRVGRHLLVLRQATKNMLDA